MVGWGWRLREFVGKAGAGREAGVLRSWRTSKSLIFNPQVQINLLALRLTGASHT
jgi:hypothetical protein